MQTSKNSMKMNVLNTQTYVAKKRSFKKIFKALSAYINKFEVSNNSNSTAHLKCSRANRRREVVCSKKNNPISEINEIEINRTM